MNKKDKRILKNHFINELFGQIFFANIIILFFRVISIFAQSLSRGITWEIRIDFGFIPIMAFNTDFATFSEINSSSVLITAIVAFLSVLIHGLKKDFYDRIRLWAWYTTYTSIFLTYAIGIFINEFDRFELNTTIGWYLIIMAVVLTARIILMKKLDKDQLDQLLKELKAA